MINARTDVLGTEAREEVIAETKYQRWHHWPINWSAVWVGTLSAIVAALVISLIGVAVGAHEVGVQYRVVDLHKVRMMTLIFSLCAAFFSFVIGGWVAGRTAGILHAEPSMLHGAIVWLLSVPLILVLMGLGANDLFAGWYSGLAGTRSWTAAAPFERPEVLSSDATSAERSQYRTDRDAYNQNVKQWREDTPRAVRNSALAGVTALLLGLVGSVIGGWMACGEPMNPQYRRPAARTEGNRVTI
jgi:hypothetical protein